MSSDPAQAPRPLARWFRSVQTRLALSFGLAALLILLILLYVGLFGIPLTPYQGRAGDFKAQAAAQISSIAALKEQWLRWRVRQASPRPVRLGEAPRRRTQVQSLSNDVDRFTVEGLRGAALWARLRQQPDDQTLTSRLQKARDTYAEDRRIFIAALKSGRGPRLDRQDRRGHEHCRRGVLHRRHS